MALEQHIQNIEEKLHLLLKKLQQMQGENVLLKEQLQLLQEETNGQQQTIISLEEKLRLLKMGAVAQGNPSNPEDDNAFKKEMKERINDYIKEIDRCIALLNS